jgi:hypothetical protein
MMEHCCCRGLIRLLASLVFTAPVHVSVPVRREGQHTIVSLAIRLNNIYICHEIISTQLEAINRHAVTHYHLGPTCLSSPILASACAQPMLRTQPVHSLPP